MIPQETIDKILESTNIVDVVGEFVRLKKRGSSYIALCPFHNEKTPSFNVSESKQIYKCFGCGDAGNVASFIMKHETITFPEAIAFLGKRIGVDVSHEVEKTCPVNLFDVQEWFVKTGKMQVEKYMKLREFQPDTYIKFGVGYSPKENYISNNAKNLELLYKYGVLGKNGSQYYDRFRGRITFPIHSISGKVIGWTGRGNEPKYINSPQSEIFDKSNALFGLYIAKRAIKEADSCYLVEGPTDVMRLHENAIQNVVATCGTALTSAQCNLIKRFTDNIILLYDGDNAGIKAINAAIPIILSEDMNARVCVLKDCDPDEYLKKNNSLPVDMDWMDYYLSGEDLTSDPAYVSILANDMLKLIRLIPDEMKRILFVRKLSGILGIKEESLGQRIIVSPALSGDVREETALYKHEKYLIWLLMCYGQTELPLDDNGVETHVTLSKYLMDDIENDGISFGDPILSAIFAEIKTSAHDLSYFTMHSNQEICALTAKMMNDDSYSRDMDTDTLVRDVTNSLLSLKSIYVSEMKSKVQNDIKKAQDAGDHETCLGLLKLYNEYHKLSMRLGKSLGRVIN